MNPASWYLFALAATLVAAWVNTRVDCWLVMQPRPWGRKARAIVAGRWGFFFSILLFAWLIDSYRVRYQEAGLWLLIVGGTLGMVALKLATAGEEG